MAARAAESQRMVETGTIEIRHITTDDLKEALKSGLDDFWARPSHIVFLMVFYPIIGIALSMLVFGYNMLPLLFPLMAGFGLIGPVAALGMYELSRRREKGEEPHLRDALAVLKSPSLGALGLVTALLTVLLVAWLLAAYSIYVITLGPDMPEHFGTFISELFSTRAGWTLIILGNAVGIAFSYVSSAISAFSLPMLLDGERNALVAVTTSIRAVLQNLVPMTIWGMIVMGSLVLGTLPLFVGLIIVFPILGHATWHLYRRTIRR
jgi:uncharacterized membrane protein